MATTINSNTTDGLVITPDTSSEVTIQSDGTDVVTVKSGGNVGIGTNSPSAELHVSSSLSDFTCSLDSSTTRFGSYGEHDVAIVTGRNTPTGSSRVYIENGDGESIRIDSSGNVGIAETNPQLTLEVDRSFGTILVTVADDAVATIPTPKTMGFLSIVSRPDIATPAQDTLGFIAYDNGTSKQIQFAIGSYTGGQGTLSNTSINLYNATNLTGTTGPDTDINISCYTDYNIQLENRLGYSATFALTFL